MQYDLFNNFICQKVMPLVYDESLSYYEVLNKLISYTNEMVQNVNTLIDSNTALSQSYQSTISQLNDLKIELEKMKNGFYLADGSITLSKMSTDFLNNLQDYIAQFLQDLTAFVWFGLDDTGHFIAVMPSSWQDIAFGTDTSGNLTLSY